MTFRFIWKLIDGDMFEQDYTRCSSFEDALTDWTLCWDISELECEIWKVEMIL